MWRCIFITTKSDVTEARSPDRVVASPYDGIRYGSIVMMKMPKPKPLTRCTKLAPMVSVAMIMSCSGCMVVNL